MGNIAGKLFGTIIRPEQGIAPRLPECSINAAKTALAIMARKQNARGGI